MPLVNKQKIALQLTNLILKSISEMKQQNYQYAIKILQQALWQDPYNADLYFLYSLCLYWTKNETASNRALETAVSMNPLCEIYEMPDRQAVLKIEDLSKRAIKYQQQLVKLNKLNTSRLYSYTILYHQQTNYQKVQQIYRRVFEKFPETKTHSSSAFLGNYANVLYDVGKYQQAVQMYQIQISVDPNQMRFFSNCAMLYTILGSYEKAQQYIVTALNGIPNRSNFLYNYSNILLKTNRLQQAIQKIEQAITFDSQDPIFRLRYALILLLKQQYSNNNYDQKIQQNLSIANKAFSNSVTTGTPNSVNCSKRILSMKNIKCLKILTDFLLQYVKYKLVWKQFRQVINIVNDYLIYGQFSKIQLIDRLVELFDSAIKCLQDEEEIKKFKSERPKGEELDFQGLPSVPDFGNLSYVMYFWRFMKKQFKNIQKLATKPKIVRVPQWSHQQQQQNNEFGLFD